MEMLIYKLPLIIIVASPKWHSERHCGLGNSNAVILDPCNPCIQVTSHGACTVNFWPLTWANARLRLYISLMVQD